jgi:hypothetical protein
VRSICRGLLPAQQDEIAAIDKGQGDYTEDEGRIVEMKSVKRVQNTAPKAEMPEIVRDDQFVFSLGGQPLKNKTRTE